MDSKLSFKSHLKEFSLNRKVLNWKAAGDIFAIERRLYYWRFTTLDDCKKDFYHHLSIQSEVKLNCSELMKF